MDRLGSRGFPAASLSACVFSTLYPTLPHNLFKDKLVDLIERIFQREGSLYIACNDRHVFSPLVQMDIIIYRLVGECVELSPFSWTVFVLDLGLGCVGRLWVFLWVLTVPLL